MKKLSVDTQGSQVPFDLVKAIEQWKLDNPQRELESVYVTSNEKRGLDTDEINVSFTWTPKHHGMGAKP